MRRNEAEVYVGYEKATKNNYGNRGRGNRKEKPQKHVLLEYLITVSSKLYAKPKKV